MKSRAALLVILLAACKTPPEVRDQTNPADAYRTFRGAIARENIDLEWKVLGQGFRQRMGLRSRGDWADARATILSGGIALTAIKRSKVGDVVAQEDGRFLVNVRLPLGLRAKVWMRPQAVLRIRTKGDDVPIYDVLDGGLVLMAGEEFLGIRVPDWVLEELEGGQIESISAQVEWFIDDLETP